MVDLCILAEHDANYVLWFDTQVLGQLRNHPHVLCATLPIMVRCAADDNHHHLSRTC